MASGLLTDRAELEGLFAELAAELARLGATAHVVMVGGSWMLWHDQRTSTRDVDSARRFDTDITTATARVAARHDLAPDWLNDASAGFWPAGSSYDDCETVYSNGPLTVSAPSAAVIFVMKLYRSLPQDREDLVSLWTLTGFTTAHQAAEAFRRAYPHAPEDPYLANYIADIAHDARTE